MRLSVALGQWPDRPAGEAVRTARIADHHGYPEVWVGERGAYDVFALSTAIGLRTTRITVTAGPLTPGARDPAAIATGVASVAELTGRRVDLALGTAWPPAGGGHGAATALRASATAVRPLLAALGTVPELTVAACGPEEVRVAAEAGRMMIAMFTPAVAARLITDLRLLSGTTRVAAWVTAAVDPGEAALRQLRRSVAPFVAAPGYREMFAEAGFADVVAYADAGPGPDAIAEAIPEALLESVALLGDSVEIMDRLDAYAEAGVDEVALVPVSTDDDPCGEATLKALAG